MRKALEIGGVVAAAILIAFGITAIAMGFNGQSTVKNTIKQENIVGTPDMTPGAIKAEAKDAGLNVDELTIPTMAVAGKKIDNGDRAHAFAGYMRIHALEATQGLTYAEMGRFQAKPDAPKQFTDGLGGTSDPRYAVTDPKTKQPVDNARREIWVTETALTTALNAGYMASKIALFGIVVGFALLLTGVGFAILAIGGALRNPETALTFLRKSRTGGTSAAVSA